MFYVSCSPLQLPSSVLSPLPSPLLPLPTLLPFPHFHLLSEPPLSVLSPRALLLSLSRPLSLCTSPHVLGPLLLSFLNSVSPSFPHPHVFPSFFTFSLSPSDLLPPSFSPCLSSTFTYTEAVTRRLKVGNQKQKKIHQKAIWKAEGLQCPSVTGRMCRLMKEEQKVVD